MKPNARLDCMEMIARMCVDATIIRRVTHKLENAFATKAGVAKIVQNRAQKVTTDWVRIEFVQQMNKLLIFHSHFRMQRKVPRCGVWQ